MFGIFLRLPRFVCHVSASGHWGFAHMAISLFVRARSVMCCTLLSLQIFLGVLISARLYDNSSMHFSAPITCPVWMLAFLLHLLRFQPYRLLVRRPELFLGVFGRRPCVTSTCAECRQMQLRYNSCGSKWSFVSCNCCLSL